MSNETQDHARRVFAATITNAKTLINRGVPPAAIIAGLLGVISEIGTDASGPGETARALRLAAQSLEETGLDS